MNPEGDKEFVRIRWKDSNRGDGWRYLEDIDIKAGECVCVSVGWVIGREGGVIVVAPHLGSNQACGYMRIPECCIVAIDEIELPK